MATQTRKFRNITGETRFVVIGDRLREVEDGAVIETTDDFYWQPHMWELVSDMKPKTPEPVKSTTDEGSK